MAAFDDLPEFCPASLAAWRQWLKRNHTKNTGVWVVFYKKASGKQGLTYSEAVDEALCWGWIDTTMQPVDDECYRQVFMPRKAGSQWSGLNKRKIEAMEAAGRMQEAGRAKIEAAKADGSWTLYDAVEALEIPADLAKAFAKSKKAQATYDGLTPGKRKLVLTWLYNAKREATRNARIAAIVEALAAGKMPVG